MSEKQKWILGGSVGLLLLIGTVAFASLKSDQSRTGANLTEAAKEVRSSSERYSAPRATGTLEGEAPNKDVPDLVDRLDPASSPQVAEVFDAIQSGESPELTGPMMQAPAFDLDTYRQNPEAYLSRVVPGRVFHSAQPSEETPRLETQSEFRHAMRKGESIRLRLLTEPTMPVSFMTMDLGTFSNGLTAITVSANEEGVAEAIFTASAGSSRKTKILAASPVTSGRVRYDITIVQ
ncbi:MAG: hypothetical protein AAF802_23085 [Planctomycetota bacterium]